MGKWRLSSSNIPGCTTGISFSAAGYCGGTEVILCFLCASQRVRNDAGSGPHHIYFIAYKTWRLVCVKLFPCVEFLRFSSTPLLVGRSYECKGRTWKWLELCEYIFLCFHVPVASRWQVGWSWLVNCVIEIFLFKLKKKNSNPGVGQIRTANLSSKAEIDYRLHYPFIISSMIKNATGVCHR